jgi:structural maintenance of chromosomes protein 5
VGPRHHGQIQVLRLFLVIFLISIFFYFLVALKPLHLRLQAICRKVANANSHRENETLQKLDQHRQSGGERAVSTVFYLMALQSMAQSPFRVVDEINQGMDPRNERMVHERMVEIACREHTSQYFLITPKLLTGLRYDQRMRVLCIASGEQMAQTSTKLDLSSCLKAQRALMVAG